MNNTPVTSNRQQQKTAGRTVFDIARYESERRIGSTAALIGGFVVFAGLFVALIPHLLAEVPLEQVIEALPDAVVELFGFRALGSFEGLLAAEYHGIGWVIGLGAYVAYSAAGSVAGDIESDRVEMLLAAPISRADVLLGKFLALLVPIVGINAIIPVVLYIGALLVEQPLDPQNLLFVHALSIPYLLCCGAVGIVIAVVVRRGQLSKRTSAGSIVAMWMSGAFVARTDLEWLSALTPMHYFDPPAILIDGSYDLVGGSILLVATVALLLGSHVIFVREDV